MLSETPTFVNRLFRKDSSTRQDRIDCGNRVTLVRSTQDRLIRVSLVDLGPDNHTLDLASFLHGEAHFVDFLPEQDLPDAGFPNVTVPRMRNRKDILLLLRNIGTSLQRRRRNTDFLNAFDIWQAAPTKAHLDDTETIYRKILASGWQEALSIGSGLDEKYGTLLVEDRRSLDTFIKTDIVNAATQRFKYLEDTLH